MLDVVGEKWTLLVLREAFYGLRGFDDFHRAMPGAERRSSPSSDASPATDRSPSERPPRSPARER